jgi:hypothetical protein
MWPNRFGFVSVENFVPARKAPEFCAVEKAAQSSGACRDGARCRLQSTEHQPKRMNVAADLSATSTNNIQEFCFWQEKNDKEMKNKCDPRFF